MRRPSEETINEFLRWAVVVLLGLVIFLQISTLDALNTNLEHHREQTEQSINENKDNVEEHRRRNEAVHKEIERYIKCVVLLKRPFTESQIDRCAKSSKQTTNTNSDIFRE